MFISLSTSIGWAQTTVNSHLFRFPTQNRSPTSTSPSPSSPSQAQPQVHQTVRDNPSPAPALTERTPVISGTRFELTTRPQFSPTRKATLPEPATLRTILIRKTAPYPLLLLQSYPWREDPYHPRPKDLSLLDESTLITRTLDPIKGRERQERLKHIGWSHALESTFFLNPTTLHIDRETQIPLRPAEKAQQLMNQFYVLIQRQNAQGYSDSSLFLPPNKTVLIPHPLLGISTESGEFATAEAIQLLQELTTRCQISPSACSDSRTPYLPSGTRSSLQYLIIHLFKNNTARDTSQKQMDYILTLSKRTILQLSSIPEPIINSQITGITDRSMWLEFSDVENLELDLKKSKLLPWNIFNGFAGVNFSPLEMVSVKSDGSVIRKALRLPDPEDHRQTGIQAHADTASIIDLPPDAQLTPIDFENLSTGGALLTVMGTDGIRRHVVGYHVLDQQKFHADESWETEVATTPTPRDRSIFRTPDFVVKNNQAVGSPSWLAPGAVAVVSFVGAEGALKHYTFTPQATADGSITYARQEVEAAPRLLSESNLQAQAQPSQGEGLTHPTFSETYVEWLKQPSITTHFPFGDPSALKMSMDPFQGKHDLASYFQEDFTTLRAQFRDDQAKTLTIADIRKRFFPLFFIMDDQGQGAGVLCTLPHEKGKPTPVARGCRISAGERWAGTVPLITQFPTQKGESVELPPGQLTHPLGVYFPIHPQALNWDFLTNHALELPEVNFQRFFDWAHSHHFFRARASQSALPGRFKLPPTLESFFSTPHQVLLGTQESLDPKQRVYQDVLGLLDFGIEQLPRLYPDLNTISIPWSEENTTLELLKTLSAAFASDQLPILDATTQTQATSGGEAKIPQFQGFRFLGKRTYTQFKQSGTYRRAKDELEGSRSRSHPVPAFLDADFLRKGLPREHPPIPTPMLESFDPLRTVQHTFRFHLNDPVLDYLDLARFHPDHMVKALLLMRASLKGNLHQALTGYTRYVIAKNSARFYEQDYDEIQDVIHRYLSAKSKAAYETKRLWLKIGVGTATVVIGALTAGVGAAAIGACLSGAGYAAAGYGMSWAVDECLIQSRQTNIHTINNAVVAYVQGQSRLNFSTLPGGKTPEASIVTTPIVVTYPNDIYAEVSQQDEVCALKQNQVCAPGQDEACALETFCESGETNPNVVCEIDSTTCVQSGTESAAISQVTSGGAKSGVQSVITRTAANKAATLGATTVVAKAEGTRRLVRNALSNKLPKESIPDVGPNVPAGVASANQIPKSLSGKVLTNGVTQFGIGVALGFLEAYLEAGVVQQASVDEEIQKHLYPLFDSYRRQKEVLQSKQARGEPLSPDERLLDVTWRNQIIMSLARHGKILELREALAHSAELPELQQAYLAKLYAELLTLQYNKDYWARLASVLYLQSMHYYVETMFLVFKYYLMLRRTLCELGSRAGTSEIAQQYYCSNH